MEKIDTWHDFMKPRSAKSVIRMGEEVPHGVAPEAHLRRHCWIPLRCTVFHRTGVAPFVVRAITGQNQRAVIALCELPSSPVRPRDRGATSGNKNSASTEPNHRTESSLLLNSPSTLFDGVFGIVTAGWCKTSSDVCATPALAEAERAGVTLRNRQNRASFAQHSVETGWARKGLWEAQREGWECMPEGKCVSSGSFGVGNRRTIKS